MNNFTSLNMHKNKTKLNKFLIIGNLFLVVFIAFIGFFYYNRILQTNQQKAGENGCNQYNDRPTCTANCSPKKTDGNSYECKWSSTQNSCHDSGTICGSSGGGDGEEITAGFCSINQIPPWSQCGNGTGKPECTFCLKPYQRTCFEILAERGCNGSYGKCADISGSVLTYYCKGQKPQDTGCQGSDPIPPGVGWDESINKIQGSFCGTIQVDEINANPLVFCSRYDDSGCGSNITDTPVPPSNTPTPTSTPTVTPTGTIPPSSTPTQTSTPTVTPTGTIPPSSTPTQTSTPTVTPISVVCGTKDCDNTTNPCAEGLSCVQSSNGSNYCSKPEYIVACKANPSYDSCCSAPGAPTATPTEIIIAKITASPTTVSKLLQTGVVKSFMYLVPAAIMLIGLIL